MTTMVISIIGCGLSHQVYLVSSTLLGYGWGPPAGGISDWRHQVHLGANDKDGEGGGACVLLRVVIVPDGWQTQHMLLQYLPETRDGVYSYGTKVGWHQIATSLFSAIWKLSHNIINLNNRQWHILQYAVLPEMCNTSPNAITHCWHALELLVHVLYNKHKGLNIHCWLLCLW